MAETSTAARIVVATRDRVFGDALALACRRHGLRVEVVEPDAATDHARAVDLAELDMGLSVRELVDAVIHGRALTSSVTPVSQTSVLTDREQQVCRELALGRGRAEVAAALDISEHTVRTHLQNIFAKLGVRDQAELVAWTYTTSAVRPGDDA